MKKGVLIPIIIGSVLLAGSATFGVFAVLSMKDNPAVTNTYVVTNGFNKIDVDLDTSNVEIKKSEDEKCYVVCAEYEKEKHSVEIVSDALTIRKVDERAWYEKLISRPKTVTISVPDDFYTDLAVSLSTGKAKVGGDLNFTTANITISTGSVYFLANVSSEAKFEASTGSITLEKNHFQNLSVKTSTGFIDIKDGAIGGKATLKASTGNITLTDTNIGELEIETSTGNNRILKTLVSGDIKVTCSTGDVEFKESDGNNITVQTTTGDIFGSLLSPKQFHAKTNTGHINVPDSSGTNQCNLITTTGNIDITLVSKNI